MADWSLIFEENLSFSSRSEEVILESLTSPHLVYEATYNSPMIRVGNLNHSELLPELGWTNINHYPVLRGKKFIELSAGLNEAYRLSFVPNVEPYFVLILALKIWVPTMPIPRAGSSITINQPTSTTVNATTVTADTETTVILAANTNRKGASIINASTATLYLELGETVSATDYTVNLGNGDYYEVPYGYTGVINGVWSAENGNALVREFV